MVSFGKTAGVAIAVMSCLAAAHRTGAALSSRQISDERRIPLAHVAKVLTQLSTARLIAGTRGPGGGYRLAKQPEDISLADIVVLFVAKRSVMMCPFGPHWCGNAAHCPLHDQLVAMEQHNLQALRGTSLAVFETP